MVLMLVDVMVYKLAVMMDVHWAAHLVEKMVDLLEEQLVVLMAVLMVD